MIELLALELYDVQGKSMWEAEAEATRETYRAYARAMSPVIVAFVAAWIERDGVRYEDYSGWRPQARARRWAEEMTVGPRAGLAPRLSPPPASRHEAQST